MEDILSESKQNMELPTDIDNYRGSYIDSEYNVYGNKSRQVTFPAGEVYVYEKNFFILLANASKVDFKDKWNYRPDYVSFEFYNTETLWPLILFVNGINSIEDFSGLIYIFIPNMSSLYNIVRDKKYIESKIIEDESDLIESKTEKYKIYPLDSKELDRIKAAEILTEETTTELTVEDDSFLVDLSDIDWIVDGGVF